MNSVTYCVSEEECGLRIDRYLAEKNTDLSRSYIQKLLKNQEISVNGIPVKANYKVQQEDQILLTVPELTEPDILPEDIPLDILYEDEDLMVVNKPKGMVVHPSAGHFIRYSCKCYFISLSGTSVRDQWDYAAGYRPQDRYGHHRGYPGM